MLKVETLAQHVIDSLLAEYDASYPPKWRPGVITLLHHMLLFQTVRAEYLDALRKAIRREPGAVQLIENLQERPAHERLAPANVCRDGFTPVSDKRLAELLLDANELGELIRVLQQSGELGVWYSFMQVIEGIHLSFVEDGDADLQRTAAPDVVHMLNAMVVDEGRRKLAFELRDMTVGARMGLSAKLGSVQVEPQEILRIRRDGFAGLSRTQLAEYVLAPNLSQAIILPVRNSTVPAGTWYAAARQS